MEIKQSIFSTVFTIDLKTESLKKDWQLQTRSFLTGWFIDSLQTEAKQMIQAGIFLQIISLSEYLDAGERVNLNGYPDLNTS